MKYKRHVGAVRWLAVVGQREWPAVTVRRLRRRYATDCWAVVSNASDVRRLSVRQGLSLDHDHHELLP